MVQQQKVNRGHENESEGQAKQETTITQHDGWIG
jgi:hypothetical protein